MAYATPNMSGIRRIRGSTTIISAAPRHNMEKVDIFEDFVAELSRLSRNQTHLMANSIYIIDDTKQRQKMTEEFYSVVKKEIAEYQEHELPERGG